MPEQLCLAAGRLTTATCIDHVEPHRDDYTKFRLGRLERLCARCHSSTKAVIEQRGYDVAIGADGMPLDPKHPVYQHGNTKQKNVAEVPELLEEVDAENPRGAVVFCER